MEYHKKERLSSKIQYVINVEDSHTIQANQSLIDGLSLKFLFVNVLMIKKPLKRLLRICSSSSRTWCVLLECVGGKDPVPVST
jgi:hypothetical protein